MMFVGYPFNRESDSIRMWNPGTNRVCTSRDVIWMKLMYYKRTVDGTEYVDREEDDAAEESDNDSDSDSGSLVESKAGETVTNTLVTTTRRGRAIVPPDRLIETMTPFTDADLAGTVAELRYFGALAELDNKGTPHVLEIICKCDKIIVELEGDSGE